MFNIKYLCSVMYWLSWCSHLTVSSWLTLILIIFFIFIFQIFIMILIYRLWLLFREMLVTVSTDAPGRYSLNSKTNSITAEITGSSMEAAHCLKIHLCQQCLQVPYHSIFPVSIKIILSRYKLQSALINTTKKNGCDLENKSRA